MRAIFISYRRDDTEGHAGRLFEDLCERFGRGAVFMDVSGIEPGRDFRRVIETQVASCGVLLAVIGRNWLSVADRDGKRRLDDPYDFVRLETASALKRDIPVIPVLVHNAVMPRAEQLPEDLKDLAFRNGVELSHARWASDVQLLIDALLRHVEPPVHAAPAPAGPNWRLLVPLATLAVGGVGYIAWDQLAPGPAGPAGAASSPVLRAAAPAAAPAASGAAPGASLAAVVAVVVAAAPASVPAGAASASKPAIVRAPAPAAVRVDRPLAKAPAPARAPADAAAPPPVALAARPAPEPAAVAGDAPAPAAPSPAAAPPTAPAPPPAAAREILMARSDPALDLLGSPVPVSMATRTIAIRPDTRYVNVTGGEVIRFDIGNKSFAWSFNGQRSSFDLARVAPGSVLEHPVTAYVAPNPLYPRRN